MKKIALLAAAALLAGPVFAEEHQPNLSWLITDTIGYVNLAPGLVILEGEEMGTHVCKIDAPDAAFEKFRDIGALDEGDVSYACIPIEEFNN